MPENQTETGQTHTGETQWTAERPPLEIGDDAVSIGDVRVKFSAHTTAGVLTAYIDLINEVRAEPMIDVFLARSVDIETLAIALGHSSQEVESKLRHLLRQPVEYRAWA